MIYIHRNVKSADRFIEILASMPCPIVLVNTEHQIVIINYAGVCKYIYTFSSLLEKASIGAYVRLLAINY